MNGQSAAARICFIKKCLTNAHRFDIIPNVPKRTTCESGGIGRRARLRGVCLRRTGSSPVSRTRKRIPISESSFILSANADMAELADALDSGSNECKFVQVQVLLSAPSAEALKNKDFNTLFSRLYFSNMDFKTQDVQHLCNILRSKIIHIKPI